MLWANCLRLGEADRRILEVRLQEIVKDTSRYLRGEQEDLNQILNFISKFVNIIHSCFDSNKIITNILYNTIEEILTDHEKLYNEVLSKKIFNPS
jgi:hypothetical protein